jgi:hypothetical protein
VRSRQCYARAHFVRYKEQLSLKPSRASDNAGPVSAISSKFLLQIIARGEASRHIIRSKERTFSLTGVGFEATLFVNTKQC